MTTTQTDETRMLLETIERFVREKLKPLESEVDLADDFDPARMQALKQQVCELGLYGYNLPAAIGGPGLSLVMLSEIDEAIGHTSMPLGEVFGHLPGSLRFCNAQQRAWLQRAASRSTASWQVVLLHHPPYSSGAVHGSTTLLQWPSAWP